MDEFLLSGFDSPDEDASEEETPRPQKKDATSPNT